MRRLPLLLLLPLLAVEAGAKSAPAQKEAVLWDRWYGITILPKTPFGYYNERVSKKDGKIFLQTDLWKREENYLNEEHYGGVSLDDEALTPSFFNIRKNYRAIEQTIDGTYSPDGTLVLKAREGRSEATTKKVFLTPKSFFASFFPVWLSRALPKLSGTQTQSFHGVLEDEAPGGKGSTYGTVRREADDEFAKKTGTVRVKLRFNEQDSIWWVKESGEAVRIHLQSMNAMVEEMPKDKAKAFLRKVK